MPFADFSGPSETHPTAFFDEILCRLLIFGFVHRLGLKILNWEPKPDSNPRRRAPGEGRSPDIVPGPCGQTGRLWPMPHLHADGGCRDHGTLTSVLISGGGIGKRLARRIPILLLKTPTAATSPRRGREFSRAHGARISAATALCCSARRSGARAPLSGSGAPPSRHLAPVRR